MPLGFYSDPNNPGNGVLGASNADFSGSAQVSSANGLQLNGQLWIGSSTGNRIRVGTLIAGSGIAITNASGSITITSISGGFTWSDASGSFPAAKENGYFIIATATATLPLSASNGDTIKFISDTTQFLTIQANTGQTIRLGNTVSAAAGTAVSTARGDAITLIYRSTDTSWIAENSVGNWTIT